MSTVIAVVQVIVMLGAYDKAAEFSVYLVGLRHSPLYSI